MKKAFKYFLEDYTNKIQSFFSNAESIEVLDGSCDRLDRRTHAGAQLLVDGIYYFFTTSQFNMANHLYVSLNKDQVPLIQKIQDPFKVVLINKNNFTIFDKIHVIDDITQSDNRHKYPLVSVDYADDIWPLSCKPTSLNFEKLQQFRKYDNSDMKNNQLHAKKIRLWSQTYHFDKTFASRQKAWEWLIKCKVYNNAIRQFYKDLKAEDCMIQIKNNGKKEAIHFELIEKSSVSTIANPKAAQSAPSSILDTIYNMDDSAPVVQQVIDNRGKKASLLDKQMDILADKMADKVESYTESDIISALLKIGSNENMKNVYILGLYEKKFYKEAEYASKMFDILNKNKIGGLEND